MMLLLSGLATRSVRPWREWKNCKSLPSASERPTWNLPGRETCKGWPVSVTVLVLEYMASSAGLEPTHEITTGLAG